MRMLVTSNALDKVNFVKLFDFFMRRDIPCIFLRRIIDYIHVKHLKQFGMLYFTLSFSVSSGVW